MEQRTSDELASSRTAIDDDQQDKEGEQDVVNLYLISLNRL